MKASDTSASVPRSVDYKSVAADTFANQNKVILVENFRFTKAVDILFTLEVDGEHVYDLLYKRICERPYAQANERTAILEAVATVILRCFDKNSIEELDLVNLLNCEDPDIGMWKGVKTYWALREALPKNLEEIKGLQQNELYFENEGRPVGINTFNFIQDLQWNTMEKEFDAIPVSVFRFWN